MSQRSVTGRRPGNLGSGALGDIFLNLLYLKEQVDALLPPFPPSGTSMDYPWIIMIGPWICMCIHGLAMDIHDNLLTSRLLMDNTWISMDNRSG